jgi:antitoxin MazE
MIQTHQTQIIKIGNSNGIRIPKDYLKGFETKEVIIEYINNSLTIKPLKNNLPPRSKWNDILSKMKIEPEDEFNDFDITLNDGFDDL